MFCCVVLSVVLAGDLYFNCLLRSYDCKSSVSLPHGAERLVCSVRLWHILVILTYVLHCNPYTIGNHCTKYEHTWSNDESGFCIMSSRKVLVYVTLTFDSKIILLNSPFLVICKP